jgi:flagellar motor switch protein FliG
MGVFSRFKKSPEGLRQLVQLWETTPLVKRQKMIDIGLKEDPDYTKQALNYVMTFDDIIKLNDLELAEVLAGTPPVSVGYAIHSSAKEIKDRFLSKVVLNIGHQIKDVLERDGIGPTLVEAGQIKLIETARKLERTNVILTKRIPIV